MAQGMSVWHRGVSIAKGVSVWHRECQYGTGGVSTDHHCIAQIKSVYIA